MEVCGCGGQLRAVENVQMRAARILLGVWRIRPLVFLQFEMNMQWVKELQQSLDMFGWRGLDVEALSGLTVREVKQLLRERSKLEMIGRLID